MNDSRLETFLVRIYVDQDARAKFLADPRGEATKAGLTAQQVEDVVKIDRDGLELVAQSLERKNRNHQTAHSEDAKRHKWWMKPKQGRERKVGEDKVVDD